MGGIQVNGFQSTQATAERWGVSERRVIQYCTEGRVPGAVKFGKPGLGTAGKQKPHALDEHGVYTGKMPGYGRADDTWFPEGHCLGGVPLFQRAAGSGGHGVGAVLEKRRPGRAAVGVPDFCLNKEKENFSRGVQHG